MSDQQVREAIASAANQAANVNCSPWFKQTTRPGDAIVQWAGADRDENGFGYMNRWNVLVILPQDVKRAEDWITTNLDDLVNELEAELIIQQILPQEMITDTGTSLAVVIEGVRARE